MKTGRGLFQQKAGGVWYVRRRVPDDVRGRLGRKFFQKTTETTDLASAKRIGADLFERWGREFAEARALGDGPHASLDDVVMAIEGWRRRQCATAAMLRAKTDDVSAPHLSRAVVAALGRAGGHYTLDLSQIRAPRPPTVGRDAVDWASAYFDRHPDASRDRATPHATSILLGRLQPAIRDPDGWREIEGFNEALTAAATDGGLTSAIPLSVLVQARAPFAAAWLEVVQHEEAARSRAVAFLEAFNTQQLSPSSIIVAPSEHRRYVAREGDKTVAELIAAFRQEKTTALDAEAVWRRYQHIFRALEESLGPDKPIPAITRDDCRGVRDLLMSLPANANKLWPGISLIGAVERGDERDQNAGKPVVKRLAPNTVRSYMVNLSAMLNFAKREGWTTENPTLGLIPAKQDSVRREAFSVDELKLIFEALALERRQQPWKFWLPALALFSGARLGELCQAHMDDLRIFDGVHYLALTKFDATGRRVAAKRFKNAPSERNLPLHSELIKAGFLDYADTRDPRGLLFDLEAVEGRSASHASSKWWGRFLDSLGLTDPSRTAHSFRHGFRNAARRAGIEDSFVDALGGWAAKGQAARYGDRDRVPELSRELERITYQGFTLPPDRPGPATPA